MREDIGLILGGWEYVPGTLSVRKIDGSDGALKIQVRMDLGLMQLEWKGRPDAERPHGHESLLDFYQEQRRRWDDAHPGESYVLSREDCWSLSQEAAKYYWRRISFFELKEYARAEQDALHNLAILDLCWACADADEDRQMAEHHMPFVTAHRFQARAMRLLEAKDYAGALREVHAGIERIEEHWRELGRFEQINDCPEIRFLRDWEEEIQQQRPLTAREQLLSDLERAVTRDEFEVAAQLRDRLYQMDAEKRDPGDADGVPGLR
jgi:hypothetical protein